MNALFRIFRRRPPLSKCENTSSKIEHLSANPTISTQFLNLLVSNDPLEPALDHILPSLDSTVIFSILRNFPDPKIGFRVFIWASNHQHLRSANSLSLIQSFLEFNSDKLGLLWETLKDVKDRNYNVSSYAFKALINACLTAGKVEMALEAFGSMRNCGCDPETEVYNLILRFILGKDVFVLGLILYNQMLKSNCSPNKVTYNVLIRGLSKIGEMDYALKLLDEMLDRGVTTSTYILNCVVLGLSKAGRVHEALNILSLMKDKNLPLDFITCNFILFGLCKVGEIKRAFAFLNAFLKDGYIINRFGYQSLIEGLFKAGRPKEARVWFNQMVSDGISPDAFCYSIMIKGASKEGALFEALQILKQMNSRGLAPDSSCYNNVIKGLCDVAAVGLAKSLHNKLLREKLVDSASFDVLIHELCKNGRVRTAEKLLKKMEAHGFSPSVRTYNCLMVGFCKSSNIRKAKLLFHKMSVTKTPSVFLRLQAGDGANLHSLLEKLCESGLVHKAYNIVSKLSESSVAPDVNTYNILIKGLCDANTINGAYNLFLQLQSRALAPNSNTYCVLINALLESNREQEAFKLFDLMLKNNCNPNLSVYRSFIIYFYRRMDLSLACSLWVQYLSTTNEWSGEALEKIKGDFNSEEYECAIKRMLEVNLKLARFEKVLYMNFLVGLCQSKKVEDAMTIFSVLKEEKVIVNPPSCVKVMRLMCEEGKLEVALNVFMYTIEHGMRLKPGICNILLSCLLGSKEMVGFAMDVIRNMKDLGYDLDVYLLRTTKFRLQKAGFLVNRGMSSLVRIRQP